MKTSASTSACAIVFALLCASAVPAQSITTKGVISGTVKGSDGSIITSGRISAIGTPDFARERTQITSLSAAIQSDGSFVLPAAAAGTYRVCVQAKDAWLDPCEWGPGGLLVMLSSNQLSASVSITLNKGTLVSIRVNDANHVLSANEARTTAAHLLLGVPTDSLFFRNASIVSQDATGRTHQILIPFGRTINMSVGSSLFQLADAAGKTLPKTSVIPILVPSGQPAPTVVLNVTGLAAL